MKDCAELMEPSKAAVKSKIAERKVRCHVGGRRLLLLQLRVLFIRVVASRYMFMVVDI